MKWVFLACLLLLIPVLWQVLRSKPSYLVHCCFALGAGIFLAAPSAWVAPIAWPFWQGEVRGLEVSLVDAVSIAVILAVRPIRTPLSTKVAFAVFAAGLGISLLEANLFTPSTFYVWQLFRSVLLFIAVSRLCGRLQSAPVALLGGLGIGVIYEAVLAVYQHKTGVLRPGGNLGHSNNLGLALDFVLFPTFALLLGTRRLAWPALVVAAGLATALVGGSRATIGLTAFGLILTLVFSLIHGRSSRKMICGAGAIFVLLLGTPLFVWAATQRSQEVIASSDTERAAMKSAAAMMMADHPFGVGPNEYVIVANTGGYSQRAGVPWNFSERSAPVHDTYYLVGAETGFIGLAGFIGVLASFVILGFRKLKQRSKDESHELLAGLLATMIIVCIHISFEWVFMQFELHYMFALGAGLLVGVTSRMQAVTKQRKAPSTRFEQASANLSGAI